MPFKFVRSIIGGFVGALLCAAIPAGASASSTDPIIAPAGARLPAPGHAKAPPALLAQTVVPATHAMAVRPLPAPAVVAQGGIIRAAAPDGSQPGVLWIIAMGIVCCRIGARILRVS